MNQQEGVFAIIDLKHDFPNEWHQAEINGDFTTVIKKEYFSYLAQGRAFTAIEVKVWEIDESNTIKELAIDNALVSKLMKNLNGDSNEGEIVLTNIDTKNTVFMIINYSIE